MLASLFSLLRRMQGVEAALLLAEHWSINFHSQQHAVAYTLLTFPQVHPSVISIQSMLCLADALAISQKASCGRRWCRTRMKPILL